MEIMKKAVSNPVYSKTLADDLEKENTLVPGKKQALKLFYKVWSGFTKYIKSQWKQKRVFSWPFIGKFWTAKDSDSQFAFVPSLEFIESGNFKYEENEFNLSPFKDFSDDKIVQMSATSIAQVWGTTKARVLNVLKDIFLRFIESAKHSEMPSLDIKIGTIKVSSDNWLFFENNTEAFIGPDGLEQLVKTIPGTDKVVNVAQGTPSVYSKMSNLSTLRSVKTPMTIGKSSVKSQARSTKWSFFKGNNSQEIETVSRASKNRSIRSDRRRLINSDSLRHDMLNNTEIIPEYPHLKDFIKRHTEYRFGKKMGIDHAILNHKTIMEEQLKQIQDKQMRDKFDQLQKREDELKGYLTLKYDIDRDKKEREIELIQKRREFMHAIEDLKTQKAIKSKFDKDIEHLDTYNYFPYTHGDTIEKKRADLNVALKNDFKEHLQNRKVILKREKESASSKRSAIEEMILNSRQNSPDLDPQNKARSFSLNNRYEEPSTVFMKPHKVYYKRFIPDDKIQNNSKMALKLYEEHLLKEKEKREKYEADMANQVSALHELGTDEKARKQVRIDQTKKALDQQYKEREKDKIKQFIESKEKTNTHFGPEEGEELKLIYKQRREMEKEILHKELNAQISTKAKIKENNRLLSDQVDKLVIKHNIAQLEAETKEISLKKKLSQQKNVEAWSEQQHLKKKFDQVAY